jgi:hypothetical protein
MLGLLRCARALKVDVVIPEEVPLGCNDHIQRHQLFHELLGHYTRIDYSGIGSR